MRIVVHDFSGHPFQVQLSRELARRGHRVTHAFSGDFTSPKGRLSVQPDDPEGFDIVALSVPGGFPKYQFARRILAEVLYGFRLLYEVHRLRPDVVLASNTPVIPQWLLRFLLPAVPHVHWWQDVFSRAAIDRFQSGLGRTAALGMQRMEKAIVSESDAVVAIADHFRDVALEWSAEDHRVTVIPNWAPFEEIPADSNGARWKEARGIRSDRVILYAGTLGLKHNPMLLASIARALGPDSDAEVVVMSEGLGADVLRNLVENEGLQRLTVLPFEPIETLWDAFAGASVLVGILEREAGSYSVPSKVLSYLCAGRPILLSVPGENLSAQVVTESGAGIAVDPEDEAGFVAAALRLLDHDALRDEMGARGLGFARENFEIGPIGDRFEEVIGHATGVARS